MQPPRHPNQPGMEAGNVNCPMCGASASSDSPACLHCGARLATVSCPSCFAMMFAGAKFCGSCGSPAALVEQGPTQFACPKCKTTTLVGISLKGTPLCECPRCRGLWVDAATFEKICADREREAAPLNQAASPPPKDPTELKVQYVRCPQCRQLMHRTNFAQSSGIIVDLCKAHGVWCDRDELHNIAAFIRSGGLDRARENEKRDLEQARRKLEAARLRSAESRPVHFDWSFGNIDPPASGIDFS